MITLLTLPEFNLWLRASGWFGSGIWAAPWKVNLFLVSYFASVCSFFRAFTPSKCREASKLWAEGAPNEMAQPRYCRRCCPKQTPRSIFGQFGSSLLCKMTHRWKFGPLYYYLSRRWPSYDFRGPSPSQMFQPTSCNSCRGCRSIASNFIWLSNIG